MNLRLPPLKPRFDPARCGPVRELLAGNLDRDNAVEAGVARLVHFAHAAGADRREDFVGSEAVSWLHGAVAPFLSSAGQLTITVSGGEACGCARTRIRRPSGETSNALLDPSVGGTGK